MSTKAGQLQKITITFVKQVAEAEPENEHIVKWPGGFRTKEAPLPGRLAKEDANQLKQGFVRVGEPEKVGKWGWRMRYVRAEVSEDSPDE